MARKTDHKELLNVDEAERAATPLQREAEQVTALVESMGEISAFEQVPQIVSGIAEIKRKVEEVESERARFVDPIKALIKAVDRLFGPALDSLAQAEKS